MPRYTPRYDSGRDTITDLLDSNVGALFAYLQNEQLRKTQEAEARRKGQQEAAKFALEEAETLADIAKAQEETQRIYRENEIGEAELTAKSGLRPGELTEGLTEFAPASDPSRRIFHRGEEAKIYEHMSPLLAPGLRLRHEPETREEVAAEFDLLQQLEDFEQERTRARATERDSRTGQLRELRQSASAFDPATVGDLVEETLGDPILAQLASKGSSAVRSEQERNARDRLLNEAVRPAALTESLSRLGPDFEALEALEGALPIQRELDQETRARQNRPRATSAGRTQVDQAEFETFLGNDPDWQGMQGSGFSDAERMDHRNKLFRIFSQHQKNLTDQDDDVSLSAADALASPDEHFEDAQVERGGLDLSRGMVSAYEQAGEDQQNQAPTQPEPMLHLPAQNNVPSPRALDPNVPLSELLGLDPEINAKIQQDEVTQDAARFEAQIRHLMSLGVPEERVREIPELRAYMDALREGAGQPRR